MTNRTLIDEIITLIHSEANNNPAPLYCTVKRVYDENYVDIKVNDESTMMHYVPTNSSPKIDDIGVLVFLEGDINKPFCIVGGEDLSNYYTKQEVDDLITGDKDLTDYVKKANVKLKFDLEDNGTITIGIDVGDGF